MRQVGPQHLRKVHSFPTIFGELSIYRFSNIRMPYTPTYFIDFCKGPRAVSSGVPETDAALVLKILTVAL